MRPERSAPLAVTEQHEFALTEDGAPDGFTYSLQANGNLWVMQGTTHVLTITVDSATGAYAVTQVAAIDHPAGDNENNVGFNLSYTVTDSDGDPATGHLIVNVDDDTPIARNDADVLDLGGHAAGNVVTGIGTNAGSANADSYGADGPGQLLGVSSTAPASQTPALTRAAISWSTAASARSRSTRMVNIPTHATRTRPGPAPRSSPTPSSMVTETRRRRR